MAIRPPAVSWMDEVTSTGTGEDKSVDLCIWGNPGSGKTNFIGTASRPFIIASEDGTLTLRDKDIPMLLLKDGESIFERVSQLLRSAIENKEEFWKDIDTICIDSVSHLNALLIKELKKQTGHQQLQQNDWGVLYTKIETIVSLLHASPFDTIVTAGEAVRASQEDGDELEVTVNMQGGYRNDFFYPYDFVLYAEERIRGANRTYVMHTQTFHGRKAKIRKPESAPAPAKEITNCTFGMIKDMIESYRSIETQEKK